MIPEATNCFHGVQSHSPGEAVRAAASRRSPRFCGSGSFAWLVYLLTDVSSVADSASELQRYVTKLGLLFLEKPKRLCMDVNSCAISGGSLAVVLFLVLQSRPLELDDLLLRSCDRIPGTLGRGRELPWFHAGWRRPGLRHKCTKRQKHLHAVQKLRSRSRVRALQVLTRTVA